MNKFMRALTALLLVTGFVASSGERASAAPAANTDTYSITRTVHFPGIARCARVTMSGSITYTAATGTYHNTIYSPTVNAPKVTVKTYLRSGTTCTTTLATVSKVTIKQGWTGYSCSFNPQISVSFPWGISFGAWPSCSSRNQAVYSTTYSTTASTYTQNNSGSPVKFGNVTVQRIPTLGAPPCYGVYTSLVLYQGATSDSNNTTSGQVCLTPVYGSR